MNVHVRDRAKERSPIEPGRCAAPARRSARAVEYAIPAAFVLLWASGFVVPRAFAPYAEPLSFVAARNAGAAVVLVLLSFALRRAWPRAWADRVGLMWAGALQPALTALFAAAMVGEGLRRRQWLGLALGFAGVAAVISPKLASGEGHVSLILALVFLVGVACAAYASIYQKRFEGAGDAFTRTALMFVGATIAAALGALLLEHGHVVAAVPLVAVYLWSVFALAIGATMALLYLIQKGEAARAASLIYLVPPVSAIWRGSALTNRSAGL
jgi:drug/metabolite transporter (DMT)-like permease